MKVRDLMTSAPVTCGLGTNVAAAAQLMLDSDCGLLPVVHEDKLVGVVTDRDLFVALATRNQRASEMTVGDVVQGPVVSCGPEEDVHAALTAMARHRVHRLPVEGFGGTVLGVVSMNDVVLSVGSGSPVDPDAVVATLQEICQHSRPAPQVVAA